MGWHLSIEDGKKGEEKILELGKLLWPPLRLGQISGTSPEVLGITLSSLTFETYVQDLPSVN